MRDEKIISRRNILRGTVLGSLAGLLVSVNPVKLFSSQPKANESNLKVKIHPLAVKRNNKDKS